MLQLWEAYGALAASSSLRLRALRTEGRSRAGGGAAGDDGAEQLAGRMQLVQVRGGVATAGVMIHSL